MENKRLKPVIMILAFVLLTPLVFVETVNPQTTVQTIRILSDGSVDPATAPIQRFGNTYVFTGNINGVIVVEMDNIVLDGAGYTLQGTYNGTRADGWMIGQGPPKASDDTSLWTIGIDFSAATKPTNVTVKNVNVKGFYVGMYVWTQNNTAEGNSVTGNIIGVLLSGDSNTIIRNYIADNDEGIFLGINSPGTVPLNIILSHNSLVDNKVQFSGCTCEEYNLTETIHTWDNGKEGNFWSDYNGTDQNGDGLGDTPYIIDVKNQDRYPLMQVYSTPAPAPSATLTPNDLPFVLIWETVFIVVLVLAGIIVVILALRKRKETHLVAKIFSKSVYGVSLQFNANLRNTDPLFL